MLAFNDPEAEDGVGVEYHVLVVNNSWVEGEVKVNSKLDLKLDEDDTIVDVKFKTYGCGSAIASSTTFVEFLKGKTLEEATKISNTEIAELLDLPPIKIHCSVLAEEAIERAIKDWADKTALRKHNQQPGDTNEEDQRL